MCTLFVYIMLNSTYVAIFYLSYNVYIYLTFSYNKS